MSRTGLVAVSSIALSLAALEFNSQARGQFLQSSGAKATGREQDPLHGVRSGGELVERECEGDQVRAVQRLLNQRGATPPLEVSGIFDTSTFVAVKHYQRSHRAESGIALADDGIVGRETLWSLEHPQVTSFPPRKPEGLLGEVKLQLKMLKEGDSGEEVREVKRLLNNAGANPRLRETLEFGPATTKALLNFQSRWNLTHTAQPSIYLPMDGAVKRRTAEALEIAGGTTMVGNALRSVKQAVAGSASGFTKLADQQTFEHAFALVLKLEGGISTDKNDRGNKGGNATCHGVTQASYDRYRQKHEMPKRAVTQMSDGERKQLYYEFYWVEGRCADLPANLALAHFNTCVNMGTSAAARIMGQAVGIPIKQSIGPKTVQMCREYDSISLTDRYCGLVEDRYRRIATGSNERYLNGWLRRLEVVKANAGLSKSGLPAMVAVESSSQSDDFGPTLREGIMNLQRERGLPQTGELDYDTEISI
jgi:lysozyme family protein